MLPRYHVATRVGELDVRDGGDDFREEGSVGRVLGLFEHLRVRVTERGLAHITQPDCSLCRGFKLARGTDCFFLNYQFNIEITHYLAGRVDKEIALLGVELRGSDNLKAPHLLTPAPPRSTLVSVANFTSVSSSMLAGLMSTMLKDWSVISMCHKLMRRSSAER